MKQRSLKLELTQLLEKNASEHGMDKNLAGEIIGRSIRILLDDRNRGIVPIGQRRFSRRPGNLFVDMRHAVESLYSLAAERAPGREISLIQMMLEAIFLISPGRSGDSGSGGCTGRKHDRAERGRKHTLSVCFMREDYIAEHQRARTETDFCPGL